MLLTPRKKPKLEQEGPEQQHPQPASTSTKTAAIFALYGLASSSSGGGSEVPVVRPSCQSSAQIFGLYGVSASVANQPLEPEFVDASQGISIASSQEHPEEEQQQQQEPEQQHKSVRYFDSLRDAFVEARADGTVWMQAAPLVVVAAPAAVPAAGDEDRNL